MHQSDELDYKLFENIIKNITAIIVSIAGFFWFFVQYFAGTDEKSIEFQSKLEYTFKEIDISITSTPIELQEYTLTCSYCGEKYKSKYMTFGGAMCDGCIALQQDEKAMDEIHRMIQRVKKLHGVG